VLGLWERRVATITIDESLTNAPIEEISLGVLHCALQFWISHSLVDIIIHENIYTKYVLGYLSQY
jgi:hypothetical protein